MAPNETEVDDVSTEARICNFCLKTGGLQLDLLPGGGVSDVYELDKIRECLTVQVNFAFRCRGDNDSQV